MDELTDATERVVLAVVVELRLCARRVVELDPADHAGHDVEAVSGIEHRAGVSLGVVGLDQDGRAHSGGTELVAGHLRTEARVERAVVRTEPLVASGRQVPHMQVAVDDCVVES